MSNPLLSEEAVVLVGKQLLKVRTCCPNRDCSLVIPREEYAKGLRGRLMETPPGYSGFKSRLELGNQIYRTHTANCRKVPWVMNQSSQEPLARGHGKPLRGSEEVRFGRFTPSSFSFVVNDHTRSRHFRDGI